MQLHELKPDHKPKGKKRVGRGGKRGTYSGRGMKGQKARAGHKLQPVIRRLFKRYPKKRGYRFKGSPKPEVVNVGLIQKHFEENEKVTPETLLEKNLVRKRKGKVPGVKILGRGRINKKITFEKCAFSKSAEEKVKKAGGEIKND